MANKGYILVEGQGDEDAVANLINRLWQSRASHLFWDRPRRWKNLHLPSGLTSGAEYVRRRGDAGALLIVRDEDDQCPRHVAPDHARHLAAMKLGFPVALVLFHREYEVLFLPCIEQMASMPLVSGATERPGLVEGTRWSGGDWESKRGVKEWLTRHYPPNRSYKQTTDQAPLTRMIDLETLRAANVPCFGTLERALDFLATASKGVYPPPRDATSAG